MRLDKFLGTTLGITRKEAGKILKDRMVEVNGEVVRNGSVQVSDDCDVEFNGRSLSLQGPHYYVLNKPQGFVFTLMISTSKSLCCLMKLAENACCWSFRW